MEELLRHSLLLFRDPLGMEEVLIALARKKKCSLRVSFTCEHALTLLEMCAAGLGYAILPDLLMAKAKKAGLSSLPLLAPSLKGNVVLVKRNEPEERLLLEKIRTYFLSK